MNNENRHFERRKEVIIMRREQEQGTGRSGGSCTRC